MRLLTPQWVPCEHDPEVEFLMRGMNGLEWLEYSAHGGRAIKGKVAFSREQQVTALKAVSDWRGVMDGDEPAKFSQAALQERTDLTTMAWLLSEIVVMSATDGNAEKN